MHELEEQVKDAETKADQVLEEEAKRHREAYHKIERDRNLEIDLLCNRYSPHHKTDWRGLKFFHRFSDWITKLVGYKETVCLHRLQQLEEENGKMKMNVCRLKSQTEKLDQVGVCV